MTFYDRIEDLCKQNGEKPSNVVESLGMSRGTMSNWKKGGIPNGDALMRFSKHFGVSTDYLLMGNEIQNISTEDADWLSLIHQLPRDAQIEFRGEIKGYLKRMNDDAVNENSLKQAKL